jgi:hypothetical protein
MDSENFCLILESALLSFDGVTQEELVQEYGLTPEPKSEPQGWALSINIRKMAERYNFLTCPNCHNDFQFNERTGFFKCQCSAGNLKPFATKLFQYLKSQEIQNEM